MEKFLLYTSLIISVIAVWVSIKAWHKSRAIYGVERAVIRQYRGDRDDMYINEEALNQKLSSGDYTILAFLERNADKDWQVLLGRIKPYKESRSG